MFLGIKYLSFSFLKGRLSKNDKSIPIPTAGVSLGLAALGNLLQPYSPLMKYTCGILAAILLAMLLIKILRYPKLVHADMTGNPILGSVAATFL